ncbi:MAG: MBL fold metallo-hydrolase, partial [bacterium]|nr:MBL fold metallo-hydrolase [bacterium]
IGFLPKLVALGFTGEVLATAPTVDMAQILLADAAHIQEEDADYRNRKGLTRHKPALPLFTVADAELVGKKFKPVRFGGWVELGKEFKFRYHIAGHILGAASVEVHLDDGKSQRSVLFSGDIGRYAVPLVSDPSKPPATDYLVCESTYGGKVHAPADPFHDMSELLHDIIDRKAVLLFPAFAVGRTQQLIYMVNTLIQQKQIPPMDINIDSPMAVKATDIYCRYPEYHAVDKKYLAGEKCPVGGKNVILHRKRKASKKLNELQGPGIIISASGMLSGGRILHHLIHRLPDPNTTLALVGYMAEGTLGRRISDGDKRVRIHKVPIEVKARVVHQPGLSAHADSYEILHWLGQKQLNPRQVFVVHGEESRAEAMAEQIRTEKGWDCLVPDMGQTTEL